MKKEQLLNKKLLPKVAKKDRPFWQFFYSITEQLPELKFPNYHDKFHQTVK